MKNKNMTLVIAICAVVLLVAAFGLYNSLADRALGDLQNGTSQDTNQPSNVAPDFTVFDKDGNAHKLSDFKGKPVVVNFWTTWCGYCIKEMPLFQQMYEQYGEDVEFLMVNLIGDGWDRRKDSDAFLQSSDYTFPVYYDEQQQASTAYGIYSIPMSLFVDKDGNLVKAVNGMMTHNTLQFYIDSIL